MADRQFVAPFGDEATPASWLLPASLQLMPKIAYARFNGATAAGSYRPCLRLISDSGHVACEAVADTVVAAGASADVTWFQGLGASISAGSVAVVGARIEAHAAQSIPNSTNTDLVYDTVAFDTVGMANLGADARKLTVTVSGLYLVVCETIWTYNSAGRRLNLISRNNFYSVDPSSVVSGDTRQAIWSPVGGLGGGAPHTNDVAVAIVQASAGDFFASGALQASGAALNANGSAGGTNQDNFLSAILLGSI